MAYYKSIGIKPTWVPDSVPGDIGSSLTPKALHKIYFLVRSWAYEFTLSWTSTRVSDSAVATATTNATGGIGPLFPVDDEYDIIRPTNDAAGDPDWRGGWVGFIVGDYSGAPSIDGTWTFGGATTQGYTSGFKITIGTYAAPDILNPARVSYTSDKEFGIAGYIHISFPDPFYDRDIVGVPDDDSPSGGTGGSVVLDFPFLWEDAVAGAPFFGKVETSGSLVFDSYVLAFDLSCTVTPSLYWGHGGRIDSTTGEPV